MLTFDQTIDAVSDTLKVPKVDLLAPNRGRKHIALARQIAYWVHGKQTGLNPVELGKLFKRDVSTIRHGLQTIDAALDLSDETVTTAVQAVEARLAAPA